MPPYSTVTSLSANASVTFGPLSTDSDIFPRGGAKGGQKTKKASVGLNRVPAPWIAAEVALRPPRLTPEAINRFRRQLRFIPTETLRQASILGFITKYTGSSFCCAHLQDSLGLYQTGVVWPLPTAAKLAQMHEVGPTFVALMMNSELLRSIWTAEAGRATTLPDSIFQSSLLFRFACRKLDEHHIGVYGYSERGDGGRVVVFITRGAQSQPYTTEELAIMERICAEFEPELSMRDPLRLFMPRQPIPAEHQFRVGPDFQVEKISLYAQSLLALFYDHEANPTIQSAPLPKGLITELKSAREHFLHFGEPTHEGVSHAFSKNHRGRVLLVCFQTLPDSGFLLTLHEDLRHHARLYRIMAGCRKLLRDRSPTYTVCLLIAEGINDPAELVHQAELGNQSPASALRIIQAARQIVAEA